MIRSVITLSLLLSIGVGIGASVVYVAVMPQLAQPDRSPATVASAMSKPPAAQVLFTEGDKEAMNPAADNNPTVSPAAGAGNFLGSHQALW
jgi:hypothetical protein